MSYKARKSLLILLLSITGAYNTFAQDTIKVNLYKTTDDYVLKKYTDTGVSLIVKEIGDNHLQIKKFIDLKTGKNLNNKGASWAITYKGSIYLNLGYTNDLNNWKIFLKFNLEGSNFCASFIYDETPNTIKNSGVYYGGGLTGVLMKESTKWGKNWTKQDGSKAKILFINLNKQNQPFGNRHKKFNGLFYHEEGAEGKVKTREKDEEIEQMSFEEAVSLIRERN